MAAKRAGSSVASPTRLYHVQMEKYLQTLQTKTEFPWGDAALQRRSRRSVPGRGFGFSALMKLVEENFPRIGHIEITSTAAAEIKERLFDDFETL